MDYGCIFSGCFRDDDDLLDDIMRRFSFYFELFFL